MVKRIILLVLLLFLVSCVGSGPPERVFSCETNDECMVVAGNSCCECYDVINKKFEDVWSSRFVSTCQMYCKACQEAPEPVCINNKCSAKV